jgi:hypothetical protein
MLAVMKNKHKHQGLGQELKTQPWHLLGLRPCAPYNMQPLELELLDLLKFVNIMSVFSNVILCNSVETLI